MEGMVARIWRKNEEPLAGVKKNTGTKICPKNQLYISGFVRVLKAEASSWLGSLSPPSGDDEKFPGEKNTPRWPIPGSEFHGRNSLRFRRFVRLRDQIFAVRFGDGTVDWCVVRWRVVVTFLSAVIKWDPVWWESKNANIWRFCRIHWTLFSGSANF